MTTRTVFPLLKLIFALFLYSALYILTRYPIFRMVGYLGTPKPWLAFVPLGVSYYRGLLAERYLRAFTNKTHRLSLWLPLWIAGPSTLFLGLYIFQRRVFISIPQFYHWFFYVVMVLGALLVLVGRIALPLYAHYCVMRDRDPKNATLYTFLALLLTEWVFEFVVMNIVPRSVTGDNLYQGVQPRYTKNLRWTDSSFKKHR